MRDVLREEKKFLLNQAEALKLRNYLSNVVHTDSHNGPRWLSRYVLCTLILCQIGIFRKRKMVWS